jgi:hypothetical protein
MTNASADSGDLDTTGKSNGGVRLGVVRGAAAVGGDLAIVELRDVVVRDMEGALEWVVLRPRAPVWRR